MNKEPPEQLLIQYSEELKKSSMRWENQYKNGCNDPFWSDGCNLNLLRNHMIYYKRKIRELCEQIKAKLPDDYYIPIPNYVDNNYFAEPNSERAIRILKNWGHCSNCEKVTKKHFDNKQMSFL